MSQKPTIPKGTRDFSPEEMNRRDYIFDTIRQVFRLYGYQPIETPAMENLSTLLGKYGEEGDRLIYRILNSGNFLSAIDPAALAREETSRISSLICEKGLRYDLTVPFARYVVQHREEIVFPFKRYQIQPVWRADRPQRGRYREFFQCDADVIGSNSLLNEYELIKIIDDIFSRLNIKVVIRINNRKVLTGIAEYIGEPAKITDITVTIDKLDKVGIEEVNRELSEKGVSEEAIKRLQPFIELKGTPDAVLTELGKVLDASEEGLQGVAELRTLFSYIDIVPPECETEFDLTLARGLDYYTGAIIEVKSKDVIMGSICGGGRYDNLTGVFGLDGVSGVGISFGADRIYDVMGQLGLFTRSDVYITQILILNFGKEESEFALKLRDNLRRNGFSTELYPDAVRLKKQLSYADAKRIPFVIMAGIEELKNNVVTLKNMSTGEQKMLSGNELVSSLRSLILPHELNG